MDNSRYDVNNNRYKEDESGQYFANRAWRKEPKTEKEITEQYLWFKASTQEYIETTRHPDGCFKCSRCKLWHYVPDNYDLLCDPCVSILLNHPKTTPEQLDGIKQWCIKKKQHWGGQLDADILERLELRDKLISETDGLMFSN